MTVEPLVRVFANTGSPELNRVQTAYKAVEGLAVGTGFSFMEAIHDCIVRKAYIDISQCEAEMRVHDRILAKLRPETVSVPVTCAC